MDLIRTAEEYLKAVKDLVWDKHKDKIEALKKQLSSEELYRAGRIREEALFVPDKAGEPDEPEMSPSDKYKLVVTPYETRKGCWSYSQGDLYRQGEDTPLFTVRRNYRHFPFCWVEEHPDGHDYLVCGEDYQGYTILQLDTGERRDIFPQAGHAGSGWCFVDYDHSPGKDMIEVEGCYWACPYGTRIYDFRNPMDGPLPMLADLDDSPNFLGWLDDTSCKVGMNMDWCIPLKKWEHELTREEEDKWIMDLPDLPDDEYAKIWKEDVYQEIVWTRPTDFEIALEQGKILRGAIDKKSKWASLPDHVKMVNKMIQALSEEEQAKIQAEIGILTLEAT